jgi:hypothetical protein
MAGKNAFDNMAFTKKDTFLGKYMDMMREQSVRLRSVKR